MFGSIKYALANLANFNGRDSRQTFWFWVLAVVIVRFLSGMLVSAPLTMKMMSATMSAVEGGSAEDPVAMQKLVMDIVISELPRMIWIGIAVGVVTMLLLVASLVRRLHDSDMPGWLVLIPGGIYAAVLARMPAQIDVAVEMLRSMKPGTPPDMATMMQGQGAMALLSWVPVVLVIVIGLRKSSEGPNRYGDAPVTF